MAVWVALPLRATVQPSSLLSPALFDIVTLAAGSSRPSVVTVCCWCTVVRLSVVCASAGHSSARCTRLVSVSLDAVLVGDRRCRRAAAGEGWELGMGLVEPRASRGRSDGQAVRRCTRATFQGVAGGGAVCTVHCREPRTVGRCALCRERCPEAV